MNSRHFYAGTVQATAAANNNNRIFSFKIVPVFSKIFLKKSFVCQSFLSRQLCEQLNKDPCAAASSLFFFLLFSCLVDWKIPLFFFFLSTLVLSPPFRARLCYVISDCVEIFVSLVRVSKRFQKGFKKVYCTIEVHSVNRFFLNCWTLKKAGAGEKRRFIFFYFSSHAFFVCCTITDGCIGIKNLKKGFKYLQILWINLIFKYKIINICREKHVVLTSRKP